MIRGATRQSPYCFPFEQEMPRFAGMDSRFYRNDAKIPLYPPLGKGEGKRYRRSRRTDAYDPSAILAG